MKGRKTVRKWLSGFMNRRQRVVSGRGVRVFGVVDRDWRWVCDGNWKRRIIYSMKLCIDSRLAGHLSLFVKHHSPFSVNMSSYGISFKCMLLINILIVNCSVSAQDN